MPKFKVYTVPTLGHIPNANVIACLSPERLVLGAKLPGSDQCQRALEGAKIEQTGTVAPDLGADPPHAVGVEVDEVQSGGVLVHGTVVEVPENGLS